MRSSILYTIILILLSASAGSQPYNGTINPSVNVQTVMNLNVVQNIPTLNFSTFDQFNNGITVSNYSTLQIKTNTDWTFSVSAATEFFSASGASASPNMPASILQMAVSTSPTYFILSTTPQQINAGSQGDLDETGNVFDVNLKAHPGYDYGPGTYSIAITYTLTAF